MYGERTKGRFGVKTNKTLRYDGLRRTLKGLDDSLFSTANWYTTPKKRKDLYLEEYKDSEKYTLKQASLEMGKGRRLICQLCKLKKKRRKRGIEEPSREIWC